jgi:tetratricopeptide (TPR) repeat protein
MENDYKDFCTSIEKGQSWSKKIDEAETILTVARANGDVEGEAHALNNLAFLHSVVGDYKVAVRLAREALQIHRRMESTVGIARALAGLGSAVILDGGLRDAVQVLRESTEAYRSLQINEERCLALIALAQLLLNLGRTGEARAAIREGIELCVDDSFAWCRWVLLEIESTILQKDGNMDGAINNSEAALVERQRQGAISVNGLRNLAELYLEAGRTWEACEMFSMAIQEAREERDIEQENSSRERLRNCGRRVERTGTRLTGRFLKPPTGERSH